MAKVTITIDDIEDEQGRIGAEVEAHSSDMNQPASIANIVALYLGSEWDSVVAAARAKALIAFTNAMAEHRSNDAALIADTVDGDL